MFQQLIQQMIFINCHSSDDMQQMKYNLLISKMKRLTDPIDYTPIPKEYERIELIYFQPLSVLLKRDDKTLSQQMKKLKEETKIKMFTDDKFNIDEYIIDECYKNEILY